MKFHSDIMPMLHSFCGPVTALTVWSKKILVGCGNEVSVYCAQTISLEKRQQVLHGACIHGFSQRNVDSPNNQIVCVYGAKQACIIRLKINDESDVEFTVLSEIAHFPDWIWEAHWTSDRIVAFALAHNSVILWDWERKEVILSRDCVEKCILYCAHFIGNTWGNLILAAGTVFNQIVLWSISHDLQTVASDKDHKTGPAPVMHTFSGHKGVIFSIKYHAEHQRLCSVSDDRSIRMWQIVFLSGRNKNPNVDDWKEMKSSLLLSVFGHSARVFDAVLLTDYFASIGEDATCCIWDYSGHIISKFKGHKGKSIWSVAATADEQSIITGGGDGSVRMWGREDTTSSQMVLDVSKLSCLPDKDFTRLVTLLDFETVLLMMNSGSLLSYSMKEERFDCIFQDNHFKSYSVMAIFPDKQNVAVGSIDGLIKILQLHSGTTDDTLQIDKWLFSGKVLGIVWISQDKLIASGPNGCCYVLSFTNNTNSGQPLALHLVQEYSLFLPVSKHQWITAGCLIDSPSVVSTKLIVCGDKSGTVYSYKLCEERESNSEAQLDFQQPDQSFTTIHGKNGVTHMSFKDDLLYSVGRDGLCRHWIFKDSELVLLHGSKVMKDFEWIDQLEWYDGDTLFYGFFSTQFVIWSQLYNQKLFCVECGGGHRSWGCSYQLGSFRFAYLKKGIVNVIDSAKCPMHEIIKPALHGRELHAVKMFTTSQEHGDRPYFLTFTASEDTTINIGFFHNEREFTQWKPLATLRGHLSSVRTLAVSHDVCGASKQHLQEKSQDGDCVGSQLDGNSSVSLIRSIHSDSEDFFLFSGGGRAEIRVWKVSVTNYNKSSDNFKILEGECRRDDAVCNEGVDLSGNNGPQTMTVKVENDKVNSMKCTHQEWSTHYLGESRHKHRYSKWKTRKLCLDPETRVMSIEVMPVCQIMPNIEVSQDQCNDTGGQTSVSPEHLHILSVAGSDGLLRVFCYNDHTRKLSSIAQSTVHEGCVLKVQHFLVNSKKECLFFIFSTATNGKIAVWLINDIVSKAVESEKGLNWVDYKSSFKQCAADCEVTIDDTLEKVDNTSDDLEDAKQKETFEKEQDDEADDFVPTCFLPAHQSGINSIHALQITDTSFLLASGGDDNALTVQQIRVNGREITMMSSMTNPNAHSAQITGLKIVSKNILVSASIDQRICVWHLESDGDNMKMELVSCSYIYLADVSCMDVCLHRNAVYLCLGGEGLCLYSWKPKEI